MRGRDEVSRGKGVAGAHSGIGGVAFTPALGHVPLPLRHLRGQSITCAAPRARRDWDMARRARMPWKHEVWERAQGGSTQARVEELGCEGQRAQSGAGAS